MAHTPFTGTIPDDRLYCPTHDMWVQEIGDGEFRVGATSFGIFLAGEIIAFTAKPKGASGQRGRGLGTVECRKTVLAVHAPIEFVLLEGNEAAEKRPRLINDDPYGAGWMARVRAGNWADDRAVLVNAAAYRQHIVKIEPEACFV
ncbi:MAG: glycine cleavage system protein H [Azonexus sp.]|jgi:glycine cleavage system H protein|nr:glycine cleavage system protein H [Azonexus sp.]